MLKTLWLIVKTINSIGKIFLKNSKSVTTYGIPINIQQYHFECLTYMHFQ